jgi:hypothetical protein
MKHLRPVLFSLVLLLVTSSLRAAAPESLSIGRPAGTPTSNDAVGAPVRTDIDLSHPANASGTVDEVRFYWSQAGCGNDAIIKFFRRFGNDLVQIAQSASITAVGGVNVVALSPAVTVAQGDLIGITRKSNCGNPQVDARFDFLGIPDQGYVTYGLDTVQSQPYPLAAGTQSGSSLLLGGTGSVSEYLALVIPVVGSTAGAFGSHFRTAMQFVDSGRVSLNEIKLVYHPAQTSNPVGNAAAILPASGSGAVVSIPDVVAGLFATSGTGSLDVILPVFRDSPALTTRIYQDAGNSGTPGVYEPAVDPTIVGLGSPLLDFYKIGVLITPPDINKTRFNIGLRTLFSGVSFEVTLYDAAGTELTYLSKSYPPNWFEQTDASSFLGVPVGSNQTIRIVVANGSAIFYGSAVDNVTNAPSIQLLQSTSFIGIR